ncbi:MAG: hypothetical protein NZZ41_02245 [Candidatus Dojkabacteria bacterium]|nr:hypothetical protein [Candidatus Dojkabacteria bacterium]
MRLEVIKTRKPSQAEYDYFKKARFASLDNAKQIIVKPIEADLKTESGIYKPVQKEGEFLPCGYVLATNDNEISVGDLVFWSTVSVHQKFEVTDLKDFGGKYIMLTTHNLIYYFKGDD